MTKLTISFAGASGLTGFPEFPLDLAREIQAEFPAVTVNLVQIQALNSVPPKLRTRIYSTLYGSIKEISASASNLSGCI